jgi:tRNA dimethylallyltransferase
MRRKPLVTLVGATGTGKSALAIAVARALNGEVVNADAYALYRGLDIGTAKVSEGERAQVAHHLIDVAAPDRPLSLAAYLDLASQALEDIWSRGRLPLLGGGSGQYVWALLEGWRVPRVPPDLVLRAELEALAEAGGPEAVHARLAALDPEAAARLDPHNLRRLVRALEVVLRTGLPLAACQSRSPIDAEVLVLGLQLPRQQLYQRLDLRVEIMFEQGLVEEVQRLRDAGYGDSRVLRGAIGYREVSEHLDGVYDLAETVRRVQLANHRLVRRQGAWFKPDDPRIHWLEAGPQVEAEAVSFVRDWLAAS